MALSPVNGQDQTKTRKCSAFESLVRLTSNKRVIKDNKYDKDAVKYGESNEEPIERVCHLFG